MEAVPEPVAAVEAEPVPPHPRESASTPGPDALLEPPIEGPKPTLETVVEAEAPAPAETRPPISGPAQPAAEPRSLPSVVVTPTLYATVGAVIEKTTKKDRWLIASAVGAVLITGGFIWLATLPSGGSAVLDPNAPPPPATEAAPEVTPSAPAPAIETPVVAPAPVPRERRARATAPVVTAPQVYAPAEPSPIPDPSPAIETAPLVVEPPTTAEPPTIDPDAPITTRPQPLD